MIPTSHTVVLRGFGVVTLSERDDQILRRVNAPIGMHYLVILGY